MSLSAPPTYAQVPAGATESEEFTTEDAKELWNDIPSPTGRAPALVHSICVPQSSPKFDSPFTRAYPIGAEGIEMEDWMKFLDGLNIALIGSPPLKIVGMAGKAMGFVPSIACMAVGHALALGAGIGQHVISKSLTEKYLKHANEAYFAPRGLRVRLCKTTAMRVLVGLDEAPAIGPSKLKKFGKGAGRTAETIALHLPVVGGVYARMLTPHKVDPNTVLVDRRMEPLKDHALPLSIHVPPEVKPKGMLDKTSSLAIKLRAQRAFSAEQTTNYYRQMLAMQQGTATPEMRQQASSNPARFGPILGGIIGGIEGVTGDRMDTDGHRAPSAFMKSVGEAMPVRESRRGRGRRGGGLLGGRAENKVAVANRQEDMRTRQLIWIVVMNADTDELIEGTEEADSDALILVTNEELEFQHAQDLKEDHEDHGEW